MDQQLNTLIAYYEEERKKLLQLIANYVMEEEFQFAYFHQQALYQVNGTLQTFKNLQDKSYDEKSSSKNSVKYLEKLLETESSELMKEFLKKKLLKQKEELDKLDQQTYQETPSDNRTILEEILNKLVKGEVKTFKLFLRKSDNFFLEFIYSRKAVKVILPSVKRHLETWIFDEDKINSFKGLGFNLINNETKLALMLTGKDDVVLNKLKRILSKIVFEIFYFKQLENETYIKITRKASR